MKKFMKNNVKYFILAVYFFISLTYIYVSFRMDTYNNYGFSYGLINGQIPYNEFNPIVPLFGMFLYSILLVFSKSIIVFYIEQIILLLFLSYLLFKLLNKRAWIFLTLLFCPYVFTFTYSIFPGYNFLIILEMILLIYLDKNNKSDKLIGFIAGLSLLTKHNIGIFILFVTILYPFFKNKKKSIIRLLFSLIPICMFILYLIVFNCYKEFFDLCVLGMKDFKTNFFYDGFYLVLVLLSIVIIFIKFIFDKNKNISYYYYACYLLIIYPILDNYHASLFLCFSLFIYLLNTKEKIKIKYLPLICNIVIILFISSWYLLCINYFNKVYSYHNFPMELLRKYQKRVLDETIKFSKDKKVILITNPSDNIRFTSITERSVSMYAVLFNGNYGYHGNKKIMNRVKSEKDTYFIVDNDVECDDEKCQYIEEVPEFIKKNYKFIRKYGSYEVYYKK